MLTLIQRVHFAKIDIDGKTTASIEKGLLVFCGFTPTDNSFIIEKLVKRCLNYRIFEDSEGKMNHSTIDLGTQVLWVPQFTLAADTKRGRRPSFSSAAPPEMGLQLFQRLISVSKELYPNSSFGQFGANMQISLCNDGPVTFILEEVA